jgi:hypothetical protein
VCTYLLHIGLQQLHPLLCYLQLTPHMVPLLPNQPQHLQHSLQLASPCGRQPRINTTSTPWFPAALGAPRPAAAVAGTAAAVAAAVSAGEGHE